MGPDALIMSDPGLIMLVRENFPDIDIHLSVQANAVNWATVKFWKQMGLTRADFIARNCPLKKSLKFANMCQISNSKSSYTVPYVWRILAAACFLAISTSATQNQGTCTNACRWEYKWKKAPSMKWATSCQKSPLLNKLKWKCRANLRWRCSNGIRFSLLYRITKARWANDRVWRWARHLLYELKDLRAVQHVEKLTALGVHSLKIEGRTKSFYYCAERHKFTAKPLMMRQRVNHLMKA